MKQLLFIAAMLTSLNLFSQNSTTIQTDKNLQKALNDVVQQYFNNFASAKGDIISEMPGVITYNCLLTIPGAVSSVINKYSLPNNYSWEANMGETESFDEAAEKYTQYFRKMNNMKLTPEGFEKIQLVGTFDTPDESRAFASSQFKLESEKGGRKNFIIQLGMQYEFPEWVIKVSMFEKVPDHEMRPGMKSLK